MNPFTLITILSTTVALGSAQVSFNRTTSSFVCPVGAGPVPLAYCAGDSLATNIIIRCEGTVGQPANCNDNLAGIPPIGVKLFAPCYESSPSVGDALCSYDGIAYLTNGVPFRIPSNVNTSTSSFAAISTSNIGTSILGTQNTSSANALSAASVSATPTSQDTSQSIPYLPFGFMTYMTGFKIAIPATRTVSPPVDVVADTSDPYVDNGFIYPGRTHESIFNHISTPISVTSYVQAPIPYGPEETPSSTVVVATNQDYLRPKLERKDLSGVLKRSNITSGQGTTGGTAAGTGGPIQTDTPIAPFSGGSTVKGAGALIIGFSTLALIAVMV